MGPNGSATLEGPTSAGTTPADAEPPGGAAAGADPSGVGRPAGGGAARTVVVVADPYDVGARAAVARAAAVRPDLDVRTWSGATFARATWEHRVATDGTATTRVTVPGGGSVTDADVALVWFRVAPGVPPALRRARGADRDYATAELHALVVSWLASLGDRVVARPDGDSARGPSLSPDAWLARASGAGLRVRGPARASAARRLASVSAAPWDLHRPVVVPVPVHHRVLVAGDRVLGAPADGIDPDALRAFARGVGCALLRVDLDATGAVVGVDPCPPLETPDEVDAAAAVLVAAVPQRVAS